MEKSKNIVVVTCACEFLNNFLEIKIKGKLRQRQSLIKEIKEKSNLL